MESVLKRTDAKSCLILVDYDNAFPPSNELSDSEIALSVTGWLRSLATKYPGVARFDIRLYGGWYDAANLSRHGSEVVRVMTVMPQFPFSVQGSKILRGDISLAVGPLAAGVKPGAPLLGTYRQRGSLPRIRLTRQPYPDDCAQVDHTCPAAILRSFTKSSNRACPVPACSIVSKDAFVMHEQKMVDTLLATDILTVDALPDRYDVVVVVSGDSDFVPPLLAAKAINSAEYVQLIPRPDDASEYASDVLSSAGVEIIEVKM